MKKKKHLIVPIFIPNQGCPYRCVFCNQTGVTGVHRKAEEDGVLRTLRIYLESLPPDRLPPRREVAFYGGSFTGLPAPRQTYLLDLVQPWVDSGKVHTIRLSTHSLFIDPSRLALLKRYTVETIELGVQSTGLAVLALSGRPCPLESVQRAVGLIRKNNFRLGLQLMPGLPGDSERTFQKSVEDTLRLRPDFVRLYPTLVIRHTRLHRMYLEKKFHPWSLERTIEALKTAVEKFSRAGIPVVRIGLHPDPALLANLVEGPFHPALRYLVDCRLGLDRMVEKLRGLREGSDEVIFKVPINSVSIYTGPRRENIHRLEEMFPGIKVKLQSEKHLQALELVV